MADHELIAAQLDLLADRLPPQAVEELADGLAEAYEARLAQLDDPDAAAIAAIAEFGDAETVTAAFFRESPWRRMAVALLLTGPFTGAVWGLSLVSAQVWTWPIPLGVRIAYGLALLAIAVTLLMVACEKRAYRRARDPARADAGPVPCIGLAAGGHIAVRMKSTARPDDQSRWRSTRTVRPLSGPPAPPPGCGAAC